MGQRQAAPSPPLMRFKAGKLASTQIAGTTQYDVKAEHKRGEILLVKTPQNDLRFQWKDRSTGNVDDDIKVFPKGSAEFTRVDTGREEDRVYLLSIKNSESRLFVWMQEKSDEKDAEIVEKVGKYLDGTTPLSTTPAQPLLRGNLGASAATAATASTTGTAGNLQLDALDAFFANSGAPAAATTPASATTTPTPATTTATTTDAAPAGLGDWDEEETLRRALEESMRADSGGGAEAAASSSAAAETANAPEETPSEPKKEEDKKDD